MRLLSDLDGVLGGVKCIKNIFSISHILLTNYHFGDIMLNVKLGVIE